MFHQLAFDFKAYDNTVNNAYSILKKYLLLIYFYYLLGGNSQKQLSKCFIELAI